MTIKSDDTPIPAPLHAPLLLEDVPLASLKPHPRNYQKHPEDEIAHITKSIEEHGLYRNVVIARDGTLLAGHGVAEAARRMGLSSLPVYRTSYEPYDPRALKLLAGDNEISHLAEVDDRLLSEILRDLLEAEKTLMGTGYDEMMLANLAFVTRAASEIADLDAAAQWAGMPEYDMVGQDERLEIIVKFANEDNRKTFCRLLGLDASTIPTSGTGRSIWWPKQARDDNNAVRFTQSKGDERDA